MNVGDLRLGELIDEGNFSKVFRAVVATGSGAGQCCAVKITVCTTNDDGGRHDDGVGPMQMQMISRCRDEATVLQRLNHPNILRCTAFFEHMSPDTGELSACAVLELCSAGTLADTAVCGLEFGPVADVARQLTTALEYLHLQGYVHGDVKMENVLVKPDANSKTRDLLVLADFGAVARIIDPDSGGCDRPAAGTICFSPPERFRAFDHGRHGPKMRSHTVCPKADVWSLGCTVWEAATGECLPLGDGPGIIGRFAAEAGGPRWGAALALLLDRFSGAWGDADDAVHGHEAEADRNKLRALLERCWCSEPHARIGAAELCRELDEWKLRHAFKIPAVD